MRIDRLCFEFDDGETPTRMIVRSEDRYDLYYVAEDPDGHHCVDPRCGEIVPPLARKGCLALVSCDKRKTIILNEDDGPIRLIPLDDGTWVRTDRITAIRGRILTRRMLELDPGQHLLELLRRAMGAQIDWHVPTPWLTRHCDRLWRI